jgi:hypothetical protein
MQTPASGGAGGGGAGFTVVPSTLTATAQALAPLGGELTALSKAPSTSSASLGGGGVESTVHDFYTQWAYAVGQLEKSMNNVVTNLQQAAANYNTSDACVVAGAQHL